MPCDCLSYPYLLILYFLTSLYYLRMNCICYLSAHAPHPSQPFSILSPVYFVLPFLQFCTVSKFHHLTILLSSRLLIHCINSIKLVQIVIKAFHYSHPSNLNCFNSHDSYAFHIQVNVVFLF